MKRKSFSSLENALRILGLFSVEEPDFSVKEIAGRLSIADSTAHRLLSTLKKEGFIAKDNINNKYRLGISIRALESVLIKDLDLYNASASILFSLAKKANEAASLCILYDNQTFYVNTVDSDRPVYHGLTYAGKSHPILSTSAGKVLISAKSEDEIEEIFSMEASFNKAATLQYDLTELLHVQEKGYAISYNNFFSGITSIAVPVKNESGDIIAAIELIGPEQRIQPSYVHTYVKMVMEAAIELEKSFFKKN
ncbi:IclR family transcriptional regulator [Peribacillus butanolivorans]|uniref:Glycerol operon regulatory protein n=1 Tax=Peribacillus butanolivorans TaxID=421767 RepID=A0AAX0RU79_9BACI|nr:IclR family transcriptional regulator [Peribacillus butanolivorans]AXN40833.1 IclR family transcriptional regulator [Peribacillus butanolivorans]PEJ23532.1 IclR family transcriptional regulator [Peribacillus butanolivorans]